MKWVYSPNECVTPKDMGLVCPGGCTQDSVSPEVDNHSPTFDNNSPLFEHSPYPSPKMKRAVSSNTDPIVVKYQHTKNYRSNDLVIREDGSHLSREPSAKKAKECQNPGTSGEYYNFDYIFILFILIKY